MTVENAGHSGLDREAFEERAAIMEFDGGMSRNEAEAAAGVLLDLTACPEGARNPCRVTQKTLATIKNSRSQLTRQANIDNGGQQQVDNETPPAAGLPSRASEFETRQTERLKTSDARGRTPERRAKRGR